MPPIPPGIPPIPGKPGIPFTFGGVGPLPERFAPFFARPLTALRFDGRVPGRPNRPAIDDIILRASKNLSTKALTCATVDPEPLAMRCRRDELMIFGSFRSPGVMEWMIAAV